jgi:hypothetical protein
MGSEVALLPQPDDGPFATSHLWDLAWLGHFDHLHFQHSVPQGFSPLPEGLGVRVIGPDFVRPQHSVK